MIQHYNMSYDLNHCFLPKVLVFTKPQNCSYNDVLISKPFYSGHVNRFPRKKHE